MTETGRPRSSEAGFAYVMLTILAVILIVDGLVTVSEFGWDGSGFGVLESIVGAVALVLRTGLLRILFGAVARGVGRAPEVSRMSTVGLGLLGAWYGACAVVAPWTTGGAVRLGCGVLLGMWAGVRARSAAHREAPPVLLGAHHVARVALVVWGLILLPEAVFSLVFLANNPASGTAGETLGVAVPTFALAIVLLAKRNAVVRRLMGDLGELASPLPPTGTCWGAGVAIFGVWILLWTLPGLLQPFISDYLPESLNPRPEPGVVGFRLEVWARLLGGVLLLFEGHRLGALWAGAARAGSEVAS